MKSVKYIIKSEDGLHARPASDFCKKANEFQCEVKIIKDGQEFNGKSILMVMCIGAIKNDEIEIVCDGEDENQAIEALINTLDME